VVELAPSRGLHYSLSILILVIAAVVLYGLWVVYRADLLNAAAFVALILGVILAWLRRRS
jgi:Flp pilus assembly protein TadB